MNLLARIFPQLFEAFYSTDLTRQHYEPRTSTLSITQAFLFAVLALRLSAYSDLAPVSPQLLYVIHPLELSALTPANGMQQISVLPTFIEVAPAYHVQSQNNLAQFGVPRRAG